MIFIVNAQLPSPSCPSGPISPSPPTPSSPVHLHLSCLIENYHSTSSSATLKMPISRPSIVVPVELVAYYEVRSERECSRYDTISNP
jgi:hypothetical protein